MVSRREERRPDSTIRILGEGDLSESLQYLESECALDDALVQAPVTDDLLALPAKWRRIPLVAHSIFRYLAGRPRLTVGELWYRIRQEKFYLAVAFGFVEVLPDRVTVLAQIAERAQDIDVARAEAAKKHAEEHVAHVSPHGDVDSERARIALMKSRNRLQVASQARTRV